MKSSAENKDAENVLVCFALEEEAAPFRKVAKGKERLSILITGIGRMNAEKALREFLSNQSPDFVLTCGFAGGLNPVFKTGDVIFSTEDGSLNKQLTATKAQAGTIFCAARIAITVAEKKLLHASTGADVVEMESAWIQAICRERQISCATLRAVSDTANEDLPLDFNRLARPDMNLDYGKLAWAIVKAPWKIADLLRLQGHCRVAAENLAQVLTKVIFR